MTAVPMAIAASEPPIAPVPAELGQAADDRRSDDEPDQVATGRDRRAGRSPALALGEDRQADRPDRKVQEQRERAPPEAEGRTDDQDAEASGR